MIILLPLLLGWFGGILVNYLSDVLPAKRRLTLPVCTYCFEIQPIMNYLLWPRRCSTCQKNRSWRVWVIEAVFVITSLWLWQNPPDRIGYFISWIMMIYFGVVVVIDMEHRLILHPVSLAGGILFLGVGWMLHGWLPTLLGGAAGFIIMVLLHYLGDFYARWLARRRGEVLTEVALGFGDVNLSGVLGFLLGWPGILIGLVLAILLGGVVSIGYLLMMVVTRRYRTFAAIPYGPFLVVSGILLTFFKDFIIALLI